jgi:peptidoglycan/LPS O-acetylase OafA/YrhL
MNRDIRASALVEPAAPAPVRRTSRNAGLDLLRLVAILLVLGRHLNPCPGTKSAPVRWFFSTWLTGGWIGVDLFFVLSGFLVSGLLFKEFKKSQRLDVKRFLIRRGFKIYPPFACFLAFTVVAHVALKQAIEPRLLVGELFFLQNYLGGLWSHTWSLAVEEHFYFALAALFYWQMVKRTKASFAWVPRVFIGLAVSCLSLRVLSYWIWPGFSYEKHLFPTHLRVDSLFFGVLLAYYHHFGGARWRVGNWRTPILIGCGVGLVGWAFFFPVEQYTFVTTIGLTSLYLGSGLLLLACSRLDHVESVALRVLAALGANSYSIYLWHIAIKTVVGRVIGQPTPERWSVFALCYFVGALLFGYLAARVVEAPFLALRDRLYPPVTPAEGAASLGSVIAEPVDIR